MRFGGMHCDTAASQGTHTSGVSEPTMMGTRVNSLPARERLM
jgi:hypothetical protein